METRANRRKNLIQFYFVFYVKIVNSEIKPRDDINFYGPEYTTMLF